MAFERRLLEFLYILQIFSWIGLFFSNSYREANVVHYILICEKSYLDHGPDRPFAQQNQGFVTLGSESGFFFVETIETYRRSFSSRAWRKRPLLFHSVFSFSLAHMCIRLEIACPYSKFKCIRHEIDGSSSNNSPHLLLEKEFRSVTV